MSKAQEASVDAFLRVIKQGDFQARFPPFETLASCREAMVEFGIDDSYLEEEDTFECDSKTNEDLRQVVALLAVMQLYLGCLASGMLVENIKKINAKRQCAISLLSGMTTDLGAIRRLVIAGYDVQARSIARSFGERVDMLIATQIDLAFANQFRAASDIDDANAFWHRSVAKGKLEKRVSARIARLSLNGRSPIDEEWRARRKEMARWLSTAAHPSYIAGWFAILPELGSETSRSEDFDGTTGLFGQHGSGSISTGRAVFGRLLEILFLIFHRGSNLAPRPCLGEEIDSVADAANKFLLRATAESYVAPHIDIWTVYYALLGYRLERVAK